MRPKSVLIERFWWGQSVLRSVFELPLYTPETYIQDAPTFTCTARMAHMFLPDAKNWALNAVLHVADTVVSLSAGKKGSGLDYLTPLLELTDLAILWNYEHLEFYVEQASSWKKIGEVEDERVLPRLITIFEAHEPTLSVRKGVAYLRLLDCGPKSWKTTREQYICLLSGYHRLTEVFNHIWDGNHKVQRRRIHDVAVDSSWHTPVCRLNNELSRRAANSCADDCANMWAAFRPADGRKSLKGWDVRQLVSGLESRMNERKRYYKDDAAFGCVSEAIKRLKAICNDHWLASHFSGDIVLPK